MLFAFPSGSFTQIHGKDIIFSSLIAHNFFSQDLFSHSKIG